MECVECLVDAFEKEETIEETIQETKELIKPPIPIRSRPMQFVVGDKVKLKHASSTSKFADKIGTVEKVDQRGIWVHWAGDLTVFCLPFEAEHLFLTEAVVNCVGGRTVVSGAGFDEQVDVGDKVFFCPSGDFSRPARPSKENPIGTVIEIVPRGNGTSEAFVDWDDGTGKIRKSTIETHYLILWKKKKSTALTAPCRECHRIICQCDNRKVVSV